MLWKVTMQVELDFEEPEEVMEIVETKMNAGEYFDVCSVFSCYPIKDDEDEETDG